MSRRPVGLDTNLFIRQAAPRMLAACCERMGRSVYLPKQTLREASRKIMPRSRTTLEKAGLGDTASRIHRTLESWQGREAQLIARLDSIALKTPKTRGGEDRRLDLERRARRRRTVMG